MSNIYFFCLFLFYFSFYYCYVSTNERKWGYSTSRIKLKLYKNHESLLLVQSSHMILGKCVREIFYASLKLYKEIFSICSSVFRVLFISYDDMNPSMYGFLIVWFCWEKIFPNKNENTYFCVESFFRERSLVFSWDFLFSVDSALFFFSFLFLIFLLPCLRGTFLDDNSSLLSSFTVYVDSISISIDFWDIG